MPTLPGTRTVIKKPCDCCGSGGSPPTMCCCPGETLPLQVVVSIDSECAALDGLEITLDFVSCTINLGVCICSWTTTTTICGLTVGVQFTCGYDANSGQHGYSLHISNYYFLGTTPHPVTGCIFAMRPNEDGTCDFPTFFFYTCPDYPCLPLDVEFDMVLDTGFAFDPNFICRGTCPEGVPSCLDCCEDNGDGTFVFPTTTATVTAA